MYSWFPPFTVTGLLQHWQLSLCSYVFVMVAEGGMCSYVDATAPTSFSFCFLKPLLFVPCLQCILLTQTGVHSQTEAGFSSQHVTHSIQFHLPMLLLLPKMKKSCLDSLEFSFFSCDINAQQHQHWSLYNQQQFSFGTVCFLKEWVEIETKKEETKETSIDLVA